MRFDILTLFPGMFAGPLTESILKRAVQAGTISIGLHDIREHAADKHRTADDAPYGGGARYWADGKAAPDGECGINTSGGLIAKGHPVGATGVAMIGWTAWQLLGKVPGELQVKAPRAGATFNIGGPICASVCTVLRPAD